jgi:protocatechuate 3,4-dioxygenase beta subunit
MSLRPICLLAVVSPFGLLAQNDTAVLSGRVTDPSGLGVSNAQIRLTRQSTASVRETVAKVEGEYRIDLLEPGDYPIRVTSCRTSCRRGRCSSA